MDPAQRDSDLLQLIRTQVREGLTKSAAFRSLSPPERKEIALNTVKAFAYILGGADGRTQPDSVMLAGRTPSSGGDRRCAIFGTGGQAGEVRASRPFVTSTGGGYFFVPSLDAIRDVLAAQ